MLPEREKEKYKRNITRAHLSHFSSSLVKSGRPTAMQVGKSHSNYVLNSRVEEREMGALSIGQVEIIAHAVCAQKLLYRIADINALRRI